MVYLIELPNNYLMLSGDAYRVDGETLSVVEQSAVYVGNSCSKLLTLL